MVVAAIIFLGWRASRAEITGESAHPIPLQRRRFLAALVLSPVLLTVFFALFFQLKIKIIMAVGTFPLMPLFLMQFAPRLDGWRLFKLAGVAAVAVTAIAAATAPLTKALIARNAGGWTYDQPRRELAEQVTKLWREETHMPMRFAGGPLHYVYAISFYSGDHPSAFLNLDYSSSKWVTPAKLQEFGLVVACPQDDSECLERASKLVFGNWKRTTIKIGRTIGVRKVPEVAFDIFIIPPMAQSAVPHGA
jgi:hypothetical protein